MKKLILAIMLILTATAAFAGIEEYQSAKKDLDYIEHSSKVTRKSYHIVADKFHSIYAKDPSGKLADDSLYYTARTYHRSYVRYKQRADLLNALKNFKLLASNYQTRLASLAYIESANLYEEQKDYPSARYMLKKLISRFPNTEDAKTAEGKLAGIEKKFRKSLYADNPKIETASTAAKPEPPVVNSVLTDKENPDDDKSDDTAAESAATAKNKEVAYGSENASSAVPAGKVVVNRVRYFSTEDYTRVVLDLSGQTKFEKHWLKANPQFNKPPRLFLDIEDAVMSSEIPKDINIKDGLLDSLRWGYNRPGVARVVLDSDNVKDFTVFAMSNPDRIVIDVSGNPLDKKTTASSTYVSSTKKFLPVQKLSPMVKGVELLRVSSGLRSKQSSSTRGMAGKIREPATTA